MKVFNSTIVFSVLYFSVLCISKAQNCSQHEAPIMNNEYWTSISALCTSCDIDNPENAATSDLDDFASITIPPNITGTASLKIRLNATTPSGLYAGLKVRRPLSPVVPGLLGSITLTTYINGTLQESKTDSDLMITNIEDSDDQFLNFIAGADFNEIEITVTGVEDAYNILNVYYGYGSAEILLPVLVSDFKAQYNSTDKNIKLHWTFGSAVTHVEVLRSSDGVQFKNTGLTIFPGNTSFSYTTTDENPLEGYNYYRLKLVDENNLVSYSDIVTVLNEQEEIQLYNSAAGLILNNSASHDITYRLEIMTVAGVRLQAKEISLSSQSGIIVFENSGSGNLFIVKIARINSNDQGKIYRVRL